MTKISIKSEFKDLIGPIGRGEFDQLKANILAEGIRDPLITWNGYLVDGHNRYQIAQVNNLPFESIELRRETENEVKEWIIKNQFGRRNLSTWQRAKLALSLEGLFRPKAIENKLKALSGEIIEKGESIDTRKELSKLSGVGEQVIGRAKFIQNTATPETLEKLDNKEYSINRAYKEILKEQRKSDIERQIEEIENCDMTSERLFDVIVIDPPWPYGTVDQYDPEYFRVTTPYPEMPLEDLYKIELPANDNCVLWLWTTDRFFLKAHSLVDHWCFDYKAILVWNKVKMGIGKYLRIQCEFCLFCTKGKPVLKRNDVRDYLEEPRREHSRKPEAFYQLVDSSCPGRKLDYFSRQKRAGWVSLGNDINRFTKLIVD